MAKGPAVITNGLVLAATGQAARSDLLLEDDLVLAYLLADLHIRPFCSLAGILANARKSVNQGSRGSYCNLLLKIQ